MTFGFWPEESAREQKARLRREDAAFRAGCWSCGSKLAWLHLAGSSDDPIAVCMNERGCKRRRALLTKGSAK